MAENGVAISRGKGIPARTFFQDQYESRYEFIRRVIEAHTFNLDQRNTLTFEFVWGAYD